MVIGNLMATETMKLQEARQLFQLEAQNLEQAAGNQEDIFMLTQAATGEKFLTAPLLIWQIR
ncbi:MAG: hypothetical protein A3D92_09975 [Bacteroidetes bacterium RIFCSPHIGHO2_02_FULL_44_7]|nr:MAG: hypothetical protein A3D92_09975 [Bacteroidetes bacterium RIFCSPHIGHO2_02_FULL_44_7]